MQPVADDYVTLAERISARLGAPRVRRLHLPRRTESKDAEFCALELEEGAVGFCFVLLEGVERELRGDRDVRAYEGVQAAAVARGFAKRDPVAKALGFAAINALSQQLFTRAKWVPPSAHDSLGTIAPAPGEHIGMIGLFPSLVAHVLEAGARLTVLELRPELVREEGRYRVTLDSAELASCEKVVSTCAVMLNDTLDAVLDACRNARDFAIVGPTAGCVPDPLFSRGVHSVGGRRVTDVRGFREAFHRERKWGVYASKTVIRRQDYPGIDWLLASVG
jgi:uncharacterized protein (DUF4213/DUF364 family)